MRLLLTVLTYGILASSLFSCGQLLNRKEIKTVEELQSRLLLLEGKFYSIDTALISRYTQTLEVFLDIYKTKVSNVEKEKAIRIGAYGREKKLMRKLTRSYAETNREFGLSTFQLNTLKKDLENNAISKEEFERYLASEQEVIDRIELQVNALHHFFQKGNMEREIDAIRNFSEELSKN